MTAHRIGIITGSGPEAGIDLWSKVLDEHRTLLGERYRGDIDAPEVVVISVPELGYSMELEHEEERVWAALRSAAERIAEQVDVYVLACNTLNYFADRLRALELPAQLLTPADVALEELMRRGTDRVALLGSRQTMDLTRWSSYRKLTPHVKVELPRETHALHRLIEDIKVAGGSTPEIEQQFEELRDSLDSSTVLLACTELPLLHGPAAEEASGAIDVSRLLARAAVRWEPSALADGEGHETVLTTLSTAPVAVLYTGGTFGMVPTPDGLAAHSGLESAITSLLTDSPVPWTYHATPKAIDSSEMDMPQLGELADLIRDIISRERPRAVVVIHGTDTMAYSAAHAAFALADLDTPLIFTGSQFPLGTENTDAERNFGLAFDAAVRGVPSGAWIAFNHRLMPAVRAMKRSSESFDAFAAPLPRNPHRATPPTDLAKRLADAAGTESPRIGLVKVGPGLTAAQLDAVLADCPVGVVLECYGAGTAPVVAGGLAEPIRNAVVRGTAVLAVTQCTDGRVQLGRYAVGSALAQAGALSGSDLTPEAALGKLTALARAGYRGAELAQLLEQNLLGERS